MKLDLHGKSHYEVEPLIDQFIWKSMQSRQIEVDIITGNSDRMKEFVIEILKEYKLHYQIGNPFNNGFIRVFIQ